MPKTFISGATTSGTAEQPGKARSHHFPELDALRGLAATVVVLDHFSRLWDTAHLSPHARFWLDVFSPFLNGSASVSLFFLLSGFVLTLPYKRGNPQPYGTFVLRRLARIYLPYFAALLLAIAGDWYLHSAIAVSPWASQSWSQPLSMGLIVQHILLIGVFPISQINTAFWSLAVEMRLSLVFPLLCIYFLRLNRRAAALSLLAIQAACLLAVRMGAHRLSADAYSSLTETFYGLLAFASGILLARYLEDAKSAWKRWSLAAQISVAALALAVMGWVALLDGTHLWALVAPLTILGGVVVMLASLCLDPISKALNHRMPALLGRISYSLYLVHTTVLFGLLHLTYGHLSRGAILLPYLLLSLGVAALFFRIVERPAINLSRSIGRKGRL